MKFDHFGVIVSDLNKGRKHFTHIYSIKNWTNEFYDEKNGVVVQFGRDTSGACFELVAPIDDNSPVYNVMSKKINILNHIAYLVDNISICVEDLLKNNFMLLGEPNMAIAYNMRRIQYLYSKDFSYLLELIEAPDHEHIYSAKNV